MEFSVSIGLFKVHPLVMVNISDHYTRKSLSSTFPIQIRALLPIPLLHVALGDMAELATTNTKGLGVTSPIFSEAQALEDKSSSPLGSPTKKSFVAGWRLSLSFFDLAYNALNATHLASSKRISRRMSEVAGVGKKPWRVGVNGNNFINTGNRNLKINA
ncbi:hypothetical protein Ahy_A02g007875 [Arachis hypogaea]|uniref:Uncharacterized protein n=1 Tax=Arachis hypogaea TaxID=3818 RepID=A0A445EDK2_ARAHY|nr:hypothetical protein Ahy_A02g007875 [Arachis hypogaea]